ncbi:uncharacterized protein LOC131891332 [Tigriopus californicus]|uniref:uncharacterized protein LOC131891332 n=1 Tax=Tigriopus californicus TaxID=6832 RepID=UPI0027DAA8BC|nr:uncharacterized protein LOC131891332 [Tigriopus californicus]
MGIIREVSILWNPKWHSREECPASRSFLSRMWAQWTLVTSLSKQKPKSAFDDSNLKPMCGPIVGDPMVITLKEGATPFAINTAYKIPIPQEGKRRCRYVWPSNS